MSHKNHAFVFFCICFVLLNLSSSYQQKITSTRGFFARRRNGLIQSTYTSSSISSSAIYPDPYPGSPVVKNVDKERNVALISLAVGGSQTQKAFSESCDIFNAEVKKKELKVPGFRPGAKLPAAYLFQIFGEEQVKSLCANLLTEDIQDECEKTKLSFVGRGRIMNFNEAKFIPGSPHTIEVECDLWPTITYSGPDGYKGMKITVVKEKLDTEKYEQVKASIMERYKVLDATPEGYQAKLGDVVVVDMIGYEKAADGSRGAKLPAVAAGDNLEITLEEGKFMQGLIEGLVGSTAGQLKTITVTFPERAKGPGVALSGKQAIFDVTVSAVKTKALPAWDETLAGRIREGMSLALLEAEVRQAVEGDASSTNENIRNDAIMNALLAITTFDRIPESLMEETTQAKFQGMLQDFKDQGTDDEQLQEMTKPENYLKYKEVSKANVEKVVKLGMVFRDIAEKEQIVVTQADIQEQLSIMAAQAKQKGEKLPDERRIVSEIQNSLLRQKVFNALAEFSIITVEEQV